MTRLLTSLIARFRKKSRAVSGSSLVETVISMTILLTILTISFARIDRINGFVNPLLQYKAHLVTNEIIFNDDLLIETVDEYETDGLVVRKKIKSEGDSVFQIELQVFNASGRLLYSRKKMIAHGIEL